MEILLAREMGFCFGVRRTIEIAEQQVTRHGQIQTLGTLVHNPQVVGRLAEEGISVVADLDAATSQVVAITAHGAGPNVQANAEGRGHTVLDTTCPLVAKVHKIAHRATRDGFRVIVYGDAKHQEVRGILAWSGEGAFAARSVDEVAERLADEPPRRRKKLAIVAQTTQNPAWFRAFAGELVARLMAEDAQIQIYNTICQPTVDRQGSAQELAAEVDVMVVIGGRDSANTRHLAELSTAAGAKTYHLERADEVDPAWFVGVEKVGVTAGASTPADVIEQVVQRLEALART